MGTRIFDVVVIGAGYAGSVSALLLARRGLSVALLGGDPLPKFSLGESLGPELNVMHNLMAERFAVPELRALASYERLKRSRLPIPSWPKEAFYFLAADQELDGSAPRELLDQTSLWPGGPDYLCWRPDYDLYLTRLAIRYGVHYEGPALVKHVELGEPVRVEFEAAGSTSTCDARFLVDATGPRALLARQLDLVQEPAPESRLRTRSLSTHLLGTRRLEDVVGPSWPRLHVPRDNSVVHHLCAEGWAWTIPFDNGITSVGIVQNMNVAPAPAPDTTAEAAFQAFVAKMPTLAAMLEDARPVRPYLSAGPLQWQASQMQGPNWAIVPPACGFTDPLLSPGLALSARSIVRFVPAIVAALGGREASAGAFDAAEARYFREHEHVCQVLACCYDSFVSFDAFRAVYEAVQLCYTEGTIGFERWRRAGGPNADLPDLWGASVPHVRRLVAEMHRDIGKTRVGDEIRRIAREVAQRHDESSILQSPRYLQRTGPHFVTTLAHKRWHEGRIAEGSPNGKPSGLSRVRAALDGAAFYLGQVLAGLADDLGGGRRPRNASSLRMALRHARGAFLPVGGRRLRRHHAGASPARPAADADEPEGWSEGRGKPRPSAQTRTRR